VAFAIILAVKRLERASDQRLQRKGKRKRKKKEEGMKKPCLLKDGHSTHGELSPLSSSVLAFFLFRSRPPKEMVKK
jgi:hypothetical protein